MTRTYILLLVGVSLVSPVRAEPILTPVPDCMKSREHGTVALGGKPRGIAQRVLSSNDRAVRDVIHDRASRLAAAFVEVETALRAVGHEPNDFVSTRRSWAAVIEGDEIAIAVHERRGDLLERVDLLGTDGLESLLPRIEIAEQSLLSTPLTCGLSHGAIDAGIESDSGSLLYTLTLADRREWVVFGVHYRFIVSGGQLTHAEALSPICRWDRAGMLARPDGSPGSALDRRGWIMYLPGSELPAETQMMQFHLFPDYPAELTLWTRDKIFHVRRGTREFPVRYLAYENPCAIVEDALAVEPAVP